MSEPAQAETILQLQAKMDRLQKQALDLLHQGASLHQEELKLYQSREPGSYEDFIQVHEQAQAIHQAYLQLHEEYMRVHAELEQRRKDEPL